MSDLVENPEDRFSRVAAHMLSVIMMEQIFMIMINDKNVVRHDDEDINTCM